MYQCFFLHKENSYFFVHCVHAPTRQFSSYNIYNHSFLCSRFQQHLQASLDSLHTLFEDSFLSPFTYPKRIQHISHPTRVNNTQKSVLQISFHTHTYTHPYILTHIPCTKVKSRSTRRFRFHRV